LVDAYFSFPALIREVGDVELTPQIYDLTREPFVERKVGTAFGGGGAQVGLTLEQLLTREQ
jgi:phosphate transport system substrate-binding protein